MKRGLCCWVVVGLLWMGSGKEQGEEHLTEARAIRPARAAGQQIFLEKCAACHGREGKGNGPAAAVLEPKPRDFTSGVFKYGGSREEVIRTISQGVPKTAMVRWDRQLTREQIEAVADYVLTLARKPSAAGK